MTEKLTIPALEKWREVNRLKKEFLKFDKKTLIDCLVDEIFESVLADEKALTLNFLLNQMEEKEGKNV